MGWSGLKPEDWGTMGDAEKLGGSSLYKDARQGLLLFQRRLSPGQLHRGGAGGIQCDEPLLNTYLTPGTRGVDAFENPRHRGMKQPWPLF